jgi:tagaturonate epimerase
MKTLGKYSFGLGDRFGHQGIPQLKAIIDAADHGIEITPVWNKSNREHVTIGTHPSDVRKEADQATANTGFMKDYYVDADHINLETVDRFIEFSDFFTIDVASYIGKRADQSEINEFLSSALKYEGELKIPGISGPFFISRQQITAIAEKYLFASIKAWEIYRKIEKIKGRGNFVTEVSMDEVPVPQTPAELFFILLMLASEDIPLQTIAPKFPGRFNKGVDYTGNPQEFAVEFESDLMVIDFAIKEFGLPANLKMSIHSGSDKFAIYPRIGTLIRKHDKGIHVKTAGTTWLEEVIGLSVSGGEALAFVKDIYAESLGKTEELCAPYADVIDIRANNLPSVQEIGKWDAERFAASIRHIPGNRDYNPDMRQLLHVAYKLAAHRMGTYYALLDKHKPEVSASVYENIYNRHICRLFDIKEA